MRSFAIQGVLFLASAMRSFFDNSAAWTFRKKKKCSTRVLAAWIDT